MSQTVVFSKTVSLTDAQFKALPTTPFELVEAQGAGKIVQVIQVVLVTNFAAGAYTNIDNADSYMTPVYEGDGEFMGYIVNETGSTQSLSAFLGENENDAVLTFLPLPIENSWGGGVGSSLISAVENKAIQLYVENNAAGNFTGGNAANSLKVTVLFTIIDL